MLNIIFVEKMLRLHRCERCLAWKVVSHCLEDATYETTKEYRDGKCVKESMKLKELRKRVWLCKCKKCGFMYQWWEKGGKYDVEEITEERYNQTNQVTYK
ncbi:MAG: hypothetical protein K2M76_04370 [Muribaculaceae bacterium]|nr:hypothetical protein [Muribaculaceae bacterium]